MRKRIVEDAKVSKSLLIDRESPLETGEILRVVESGVLMIAAAVTVGLILIAAWLICARNTCR